MVTDLTERALHHCQRLNERYGKDEAQYVRDRESASLVYELLAELERLQIQMARDVDLFVQMRQMAEGRIYEQG